MGTTLCASCVHRPTKSLPAQPNKRGPIIATSRVGPLSAPVAHCGVLGILETPRWYSGLFHKITVGANLADRDHYPFAISFIDPLFAVAIDIGFGHGILEETWLKEGHRPIGIEWFNLGVFGLGLVAIVIGWAGYHRSLRTKPIRLFPRFSIDVLLVLLYAIILVQYRNFEVVLALFVACFLLYAIWDFLKVLEHPKQFDNGLPFRKRYRREIVTLVWLAFFGLFFAGLRIWGWNRTLILVLSYLTCIG